MAGSLPAHLRNVKVPTGEYSTQRYYKDLSIAQLERVCEERGISMDTYGTISHRRLVKRLAQDYYDTHIYLDWGLRDLRIFIYRRR